MKHSISSKSSTETEKIGHKLGAKLKGGEVIELVSDLGGGKTTFVRGVANGFGSKDKVASPTFTVNKEYVSGDKRIMHYDFYRLNDPGLLKFELTEALNDPNTVTIIEWADIVQDVLPTERLTIHIKASGDQVRDLSFNFPKYLDYLLVLL
ncbi:tRNA (adenosine(37)-N6)-threonylcarbamoyltransferase complex ATPase subunit type 1 TsaE [Candidatus Saccharibacteria bacterium]|nr:tRNA (adenosine(37)-N6)-threonylcarbamoyltransferase complex ATPase subunit type 1 TsaE [Candidatus Saccharibacteria bacterium]